MDILDSIFELMNYSNAEVQALFGNLVAQSALVPDRPLGEAMEEAKKGLASLKSAGLI